MRGISPGAARRWASPVPGTPPGGQRRATWLDLSETKLNGQAESWRQLDSGCSVNRVKRWLEAPQFLTELQHRTPIPGPVPGIIDGLAAGSWTEAKRHDPHGNRRTMLDGLLPKTGLDPKLWLLSMSALNHNTNGGKGPKNEEWRLFFAPVTTCPVNFEQRTFDTVMPPVIIYGLSATRQGIVINDAKAALRKLRIEGL